jgi:hypothetical protein
MTSESPHSIHLRFSLLSNTEDFQTLTICHLQTCTGPRSSTRSTRSSTSPSQSTQPHTPHT